MVSSDAVAWCVCPCMFRSTNNLLAFYTIVLVYFHKTYNKTITEFGFCDIRNNQGLGPASTAYTCLDLDYSGYHKNLNQLLFIISWLNIPYLYNLHGGKNWLKICYL